MRGGKRKGAGRKPGSTKKDTKEPLCLRVRPKIKKFLKKQTNQSTFVENLIKKEMAKEKT